MARILRNLPLPVGNIGTFHLPERRAELYVASAFHADAGDQMIAGPAGVQPAFVQFRVGFFFRPEPVDAAPDILEGSGFIGYYCGD